MSPKSGLSPLWSFGGLVVIGGSLALANDRNAAQVIIGSQVVLLIVLGFNLVKKGRIKNVANG